MPISHKYKLIFIHIPKCAGISIWHALDLTLSEDNLISVTPPILQHLLPKQLKGKYIDKKTWDAYSKFTIIRNPYDRIISDYFWMKDNPEAKRLITGTFDDFLTLREDIVNNNRYKEDIYFDHFYPMHFYFEGIDYDRVIRFENINEEYEELRQLFGIENKLPRVNESNRKGFVLNKEQQDRIYKLYKKDFMQLGYDENYKEPVSVSKPQPASSNTTNVVHMPVSNIIVPLNTSKVQVFWASNDMLFSEENSQVKIVELNTYSQSYSFNINSGNQQIIYFRFDIGDQIGVINIHNILIQNLDGKTLWTWNTNDIKDKNDLILIENIENVYDKTIQLSFSDDPQLIIQLSDLNFNDVNVEISLSALSNDQVVALRKLNLNPLSFYSSKDLIAFKTEKNALTNEVNSLNDILFQLKSKNALLLNDVETKSKLLEEISGGKQMLEGELKFKNELITKGITEKENLENKFQDATNAVKNLEAVISAKDILIVKNEAAIQHLTLKIKDLETELEKEKKKSDSHISEINLLKNNNEDLGKAIQINFSRISELEQKVSEKDKHIHNSEGNNQQLTFKVETLQKALDSERKNYNESSEKNERIQKQLADDKIVLISEINLKNDLINKSINDSRQLQDELILTRANLDAAFRKVKEIESEASNKELKISTVEHLNKELENALAVSQHAKNEKSKVITELENTIEINKVNNRMNDDRREKEIKELKDQLKWYKDTYETRSVLGIIKDKVFKSVKKSNKEKSTVVENTNNLSGVEKQLKWYRDTYETRSILGIIKDRVLKFFKEGNRKKITSTDPNLDKRIQWYRDTYENRSILGIMKDRVLKSLKIESENNIPVKKTEEYVPLLTNNVPDDIKVSVIIPTYNRSQLLPKLLDCWKEVDKVTKYKYEIIFSDDGSDDGSIAILQKEKQLPVKVIKNNHGGPAKARNSAILQAKGEKLLIIGDDIFPNPQLINQHYEKLQELPLNKAVLGEVIWHKELEINVLMKHITELGQEQFSFNAFNPHEYIDFRHFYTCNISIDRAFVLAEKIIFDESFYKVNFEDVELGYRLAKKGMEIFYFPEAVAEHHHSYKSVSAFCKRQETCGEMAIVFRKMHGEEVEWVTQVENVSNLWSTYLAGVSDADEQDGLIKYVLNCCQSIENNKDVDKKSLEAALSNIYRVIFRFHYEKGIAFIKFNPTDAEYDKVFYTYFWPAISEYMNQLKETVGLPDFKCSHADNTVKLVIQVDNLEQVIRIREHYKDCVHYLRFVLPSEANSLSDRDFIYSPEKNFLIHASSMNQLVLFLQTYPKIDAILLSFGLYDLPAIGLSANLANNIIRRVSSRYAALNELNSIKIIRLIGEVALKDESWNSILGKDFEYDAYGFLYKKSLPVYRSSFPFELKRTEITATKKTVFVFPTFLAVGGVEKNTIEIINHLKEEYNFVVVTFERLAKAQGTLHTLFLASCEAVYDLTELSSHENILNYLDVLNEVYAPQVVWICNGTPWLASNTINLRELFNKAAIIDQQVYDTDEGWVQLYKKRDTGLINFDRFIAINSKIKDVFTNAAGIDPDQVDLIYSAMSIEKRKQAIVKDNKELRKKFKLDPTQKYFVFIGRLTRQKSPLDLLKLIQLVVARYKGEYKFILVGSGELAPQVEKFISDNKLSQFIVRHEFIENTFEISKVSEAIMFTSLYEGLSIALLEALSVGTPAMSTDVGDTKLILDKFENGLVFPKIGDINGYFSGFEHFLANKDFFKRNAEKNKEKIASLFSPGNIASQYAMCFENAAVTVNSELV